MNSLLRRQLRRHGLDEGALSEPVRELLRAVGEAYDQADDDRRLLERSLELTSQELMQRNRELRADVEARTRAEQALRERDAQTRAILAALPDVMLVVAPDRTVRELHVPGPSFLTEPAAALVGRPLPQVLPSEMLEALLPALERAAQVEGAQRLELGLSAGGRRQRYEARLTVSAMGDIVVVIRDQTEWVQMAERLRVADRMASVGTLAAGVAHELNNPLAYVMGNLELLQQALLSPPGDDAELLAMIEEALQGARRMRGITQDLRTFSRPHAEAMEAVDPRAVMDSALRMAATEIRHRAGLCRDYEEVPAVFADPGKLGQVFLNLVVNAVQALPVGEAAQHEILVRTTTDAEGWAVVEVSDTGPGIPRHLAARIFEPFVTTKPRGEGTGLGLSICHNIVTSLGGRISMEPRLPHGTTFRVVLPPSGPAELRPSAPTGPEPASTRARARRVLVIDDDALVARTLRRMLKGPGEVVVTSNGREGLERLRADPRFDVVLCDLMMPELSGMDVYEAMEEERPELTERFIFMTGGAFTDRARAFLERVPNPRLDKPFNAKDLQRVVLERESGG
ncbi:MAG: response regulator [Myxococcales bacterium]|nr:response regulator [Myxococcales bacterium]